MIVSTAPDCGPPRQEYLGITDTQLVIDPVAAGVTQYVCITARNSAGSADASNNGFSFVYDANLLGPFSITGPTAPVETLKPTITWSPSANVTDYDLVITIDAAFPTVVQSHSGLTGTSFMLPTDLADQTLHFVRVIANNADGSLAASNSGSFSFTVETPVVSIDHTMFVISYGTAISGSPIFPPFSVSFGSIMAADWQCSRAASNAGLVPGGWNGFDITYKAVLSINGENARDRLNITGGIENTAGDLIANDLDDLFDGSLQNPVRVDENGVEVAPGTLVWTGTLQDGSWGSDSCAAWNDSSLFAVMGNPFSSNNGWIGTSTSQCNIAARLYCISQ